jgi:hypothetical protein
LVRSNGTFKEDKFHDYEKVEPFNFIRK